MADIGISNRLPLDPKPTGSAELRTIFKLLDDDWMDDFRFYVPFNSMPERWEGDNERFCSIEYCLRLKRFAPPPGIEPRVKCLRNQGRTKGEGWSTAN